MPEALAYDFRVDTLTQKLRGVRMTQVMETNVGETGTAYQSREGSRECVWRPSGTSMSVPVEDWRDEFYRRISEGRDIDRNSYRATFRRARDKLKALGKIAFYDDQAWIIWRNGT